MAAFRLFLSALRRQLACRRRLHRLVTVGTLMSAFLIVSATCADAQEVIEYYGTDAVGSIRVVFAPNGTVKARSDYLPFGEEWQPATPGGPLPSQRFTGQQRDMEEGHDNFSARSYQTRAGRMTTTDPVLAGLFEPQRWNRYVYALNNPLSYVDPDGRDPILNFTDSTTVMGRTTDNSGRALPWALVAGDYTVNGIEAIPGWAWYSPSSGAIDNFDNSMYGTWREIAGAGSDSGGEGAEEPPVPPTPPTPPGPGPTPPCELPCATPPPPGGPTITTPGVVGWKTGGYELVFNRKGHNAASAVLGGAAVGSVVAVGYRYAATLIGGLKLDGPSKGYAHSQGRLFQVRYGPTILMRVDLHSRSGPPATAPPRWHVHILPLKGGEHGYIIGRK